MNRKENTKSEFLDLSIILSFRAVINSSPIFAEHESYKHQFNLICVFMDRIDSSIRYLNAHADMPESEEAFINFLVYAAMLRDGIVKLCENVFHIKPPWISEKKYFSNAMSFKKPYFSPDDCPTDDDFFEYLRALTFAHPFSVSGRNKRRPFIKKGEVQYCPWVIVSNDLPAFGGFKDAVGVRVYSSIDEEGLTDITISFSALKEYIQSRYYFITELTKMAEKGVIDQNEKWKQVKINRNQQSTDILREIISILNDRFVYTGTIERILCDLECPLSTDFNNESVEIYREAILDAIPSVCNCVDALDSSSLDEALSFVDVRPEKMHPMAHYQLEKIFTYLDSRSEHIDQTSNEYWGLLQADEFAKGFAKKWVLIDAFRMSYDEIKLLVRVACFLETREQKDR